MASARSVESGNQGYHEAVMAEEVLEHLLTDPSGAYLDATFGGGGHTRKILDRLGDGGRLISLDRDWEAVERGRGLFAEDIRLNRLRIEHAEFSRLGEFCALGSLTGALFDLGVSSRQLDAKSKGFSFAPGTALDMRMGGEGSTAGELLKDWDEWELASVFRKNADIDEARRLARIIVAMVEEGRELTSDLLREAVERLPGMRGDNRNSMLARVFQAIRMEVNGEIGQIEAGIKSAVECLRVGGRLCVLSYHSVEDRAVKEALADFERGCVCPPNLPVCVCGGENRVIRKVIRKPALPGEVERVRNPRSRSAKLRVVEKTAPQGGRR